MTFRPARPEKLASPAVSNAIFLKEQARLRSARIGARIDDSCAEGTLLGGLQNVTYAERWHGFHLAALPRRTISSLGSCSRQAQVPRRIPRSEDEAEQRGPRCTMVGGDGTQMQRQSSGFRR